MRRDGTGRSGALAQAPMVLRLQDFTLMRNLHMEVKPKVRRFAHAAEQGMLVDFHAN